MVTSGRSACMLSHALFATQWTVAHQIPLPKGFSRQEYWSALPFPPPGDLPDPGMEPASLTSPALQADSLRPSHLRSTPPTQREKEGNKLGGWD